MKYLILILFWGCLLMACSNDDYLHDGGLANPNVNMTTYDYLKSNPLFDTLVMTIDKLNLKDEVNAAGTLYAPTNFSFTAYIMDELEALRKLQSDTTYTYANIPVVSLDSVRMYIFKERLTRDDLSKDGKVYTSLLGMELKLSKEPVSQYTDVLVNKPEYLYFIKKVGKRFDSYDETVAGTVGQSEKDQRIQVQTSGIITTTGVVHVLANSHKFVFHAVKNR